MSVGFELAIPAIDKLDFYVDALERGWSPDNVRGRAAAEEQLAAIRADPVAFVDGLDDEAARGGPIMLADGSQVARLPGFVRWMWNGAFVGSIGFRWQPGTSLLPPHVPGHIGFAVVPWMRGAGHATAALRLLLPMARARGLSSVELTTDPDNIASQTVIARCGGVLVERFTKVAALGGGEALRYRIALKAS
jgi:predicted acetyltransferase